jgi:GntR family transcriptional regulator
LRLKVSGKEDFRRPLYELLKGETGIVADNAREEFLAVMADGPTARRLKVKKGMPLLLRRRIRSTLKAARSNTPKFFTTPGTFR